MPEDNVEEIANKLVEALINDLNKRIGLHTDYHGNGFTFKGDAIWKGGATLGQYEELKQTWRKIVEDHLRAMKVLSRLPLD